MKYSTQEVLQFVAEEDVKFVRLAFCDIFGKLKNISIMASELSRAFKYGIAIDASAISGFGGVVHSDLFLHPDPETLTILPWRPDDGRVVRMFCSVTHPDGTPFENDTRSILIDAADAAKEAGYSFNFGTEMEFYLFKQDDEGYPTEIPFDKAGYMDLAPDDRSENVRRGICLALEQMDIQPESSHHEDGPGQNEIDFRYADALTAADNCVSFISVAKAIANINGLSANFMPRPLKDAPGSGMHINISVVSLSEKTEKTKETGAAGLTPVMESVTAGIMNRIPDMTLFLNSVDQSYERLGRDKSPGYISWSAENRSQLIRIPAASGIFKRVELRSADAAANPYLALALLIYAGLEGIENGEKLPAPADINLFSADEETIKGFTPLPKTRREAAAIAGSSDFIKKHLPEGLIKMFIA